MKKLEFILNLINTSYINGAFDYKKHIDHWSDRNVGDLSRSYYEFNFHKNKDLFCIRFKEEFINSIEGMSSSIKTVYGDEVFLNWVQIKSDARFEMWCKRYGNKLRTENILARINGIEVVNSEYDLLITIPNHFYFSYNKLIGSGNLEVAGHSNYFDDLSQVITEKKEIYTDLLIADEFMSKVNELSIKSSLTVLENGFIFNNRYYESLDLIKLDGDE